MIIILIILNPFKMYIIVFVYVMDSLFKLS